MIETALAALVPVFIINVLAIHESVKNKEIKMFVAFCVLNSALSYSFITLIQELVKQ